MNPVFGMKCCGFVENTTQIWFFACNFNSLVCIDKTEGKIKKIVKIPDDNICEKNLYSLIVKDNNNLILIPDRSDKIVCYNTETENFSIIFLGDYIKTSSASNYKAAYVYENEIIMLPNRTDKIIFYNYLHREILTVEMKSTFLDELYPNKKVWFRPQFEILNDDLFIPFAEAGAILKLNLLSKEVEIKMVEGLSGCDTINYYNDKFYLAAWNEKKIYAIDMDFRITDVYTDYPIGLKANEHIFAYSLLEGEKILYFPQLGNMIISFNLKDKTIKEEMLLQTLASGDINTYLAQINEEGMVALMAGDCWLSVFFYLDGILCKKPYCAWNVDYNNEIIKDYLIEYHYFDLAHENSQIGLNALMNMLENDKKSNFPEGELEDIKKSGEKIYRCISRE